MDCSVQPEQVTFSHLPWIFVYSLFTSHMSQQNMKRNMLVKLVLDHLGIPIISQVQPNMDIYIAKQILGVSHMHRDQLQ